MTVKINPKLEGLFVNNVVMESMTREEGHDWRVYCAATAAGQRPAFLYCNGAGRVNLGKGDVYFEKTISPQETSIPWDDEQAVHNFSETHFQLKQRYASMKKEKYIDWEDFSRDLSPTFTFYRVAPPVCEEELLKIPRSDLEASVDYHVGGNFTLDPRIKAWGYGGLVRFPQHTRFVPWTKFRGHALIIKSPKSGCSHIAKRTMPTYDQISTKSFEGFADADGNVAYSPLHENYHACVLDEIDQLDDGVMRKLFAFMESGEYLSVKATKRINNQGNSRVSFITNPKSMDENRGMVFAVNSILDAYFDVLFKLTAGNFVAAMSRFGLVIVSSNVKEAEGKPLPWREQTYHDEVSSSLFDVLSHKVAKVYDDDQTQSWLSRPIDFYNEAVKDLIDNFEDFRLKSAWGSQRVAYRHVKGAALEISLAENAFDLLHGNIDTSYILEDAGAILEDVVGWNLDSLREIVNTSKREESVDALASRLKRAKPAYIVPILAALIRSPTGREVDLEASLDSLPRSTRDALDSENFFCWSRIARSIRHDGAYRRLAHSLSTFDVAVAKSYNNTYEFHMPPERKERIRAGIEKAFGVLLVDDTHQSNVPLNKRPFNSAIEIAYPNNPNNPTPTENSQGKFGVSKIDPEASPPNLPQLTPRRNLPQLTPNLPQDVKPEITSSEEKMLGVSGVSKYSGKILKPDVNQRTTPNPTIKRVVFKPNHTHEEVDY